MILMGIMTILYEYKRNDIYSIVIISILLISIYILIYFRVYRFYINTIIYDKAQL